MSENYIVINGKRTELTEEQMKVLGIEVKKNPFDRVSGDDKHYYAIVSGDVLRRVDINDKTDRRLYNAINYFNDKAFAKQVALHQLLYRKLLKFVYDNECEDAAEWDGNSSHWAIRYNDNLNKFDSYCQNAYKAPDVYFDSEEGAKRAIHEVVEPFMEEHPEFVW